MKYLNMLFLLLLVLFMFGCEESFEESFNDANNKQNGEYVEHWKNGNIKVSTTYKNSMLNGLYEENWEHGKPKYIGNYINDIKDGTHKSYSYSGSYSGVMENLSNYKDGELHGLQESYNSQGKILTKENYFEGKKHGECNYYYKNGMIKIKSNYQNGILEGEYVEYNDNGKITSKAVYKEGKKNGLKVVYDYNGEIKSKIDYVDDKIRTTNNKTYKNVKWKFSSDKGVPHIYYNGMVEKRKNEDFFPAHGIEIIIRDNGDRALIGAIVTTITPNFNEYELEMTDDSYISAKANGVYRHPTTISISGSMIAASAEELIPLFVKYNTVELTVVKKGWYENEYFTIKVDCRGFTNLYNKLL